MDSTKSEKMKNMLRKKQKCDKVAQEIVLHLIEPNVGQDYLLQNASKIHSSHWEDIIEERRLTGTCGWVLCSAQLQAPPKQRYIIRNKKVLDITERKNYCSSGCYGSSEHFKRQIPDSPLWLRDEEPEPAFKLVEDSKKADVSLEGLVVRLSTIDLDPSSSSDSEDTDDLEREQVPPSDDI